MDNTVINHALYLGTRGDNIDNKENDSRGTIHLDACSLSFALTDISCMIVVVSEKWGSI